MELLWLKLFYIVWNFWAISDIWSNFIFQKNGLGRSSEKQSKSIMTMDFFILLKNLSQTLDCLLIRNKFDSGNKNNLSPWIFENKNRG